MKVPVRGRQFLLKTKHFLPDNVIWPALPNQSPPKKIQFLAQPSPSREWTLTAACRQNSKTSHGQVLEKYN